MPKDYAYEDLGLADDTTELAALLLRYPGVPVVLADPNAGRGAHVVYDKTHKHIEIS